MPVLISNILPFSCLAIWMKWPHITHRIFFAIVSLWLPGHPLLGPPYEERLHMDPGYEYSSWSARQRPSLRWRSTSGWPSQQGPSSSETTHWIARGCPTVRLANRHTMLTRDHRYH